MFEYLFCVRESRLWKKCVIITPNAWHLTGLLPSFPWILCLFVVFKSFLHLLVIFATFFWPISMFHLISNFYIIHFRLFPRSSLVYTYSAIPAASIFSAVSVLSDATHSPSLSNMIDVTAQIQPLNPHVCYSWITLNHIKQQDYD